MEYQRRIALVGVAPTTAHTANLRQISRRQVTVPPIKVEMLVVAVDEHYIYCDSQDQAMYEEDLGLEEHWKFDRDTGEEIDFDPAGSETGSRLICSPA